MNQIFSQGRYAVFVALLAISLAVPTTDARAFTNGQSAVDAIGQYDGTSYSNPVPSLTKGRVNNGPDRFGFETVSSIVIDSVNHRMFVADQTLNRVLVYDLNASNVLVDHLADFVLGQPDFNTLQNPGVFSASTLVAPRDMAYDSAGQRLFVPNGNRVSVFDVSTITNNEDAIAILGQANTIASVNGNSQILMTLPVAVAYDSAGQRLFVAEQTNNRVTVFDVTTVTTGEAAINVLGQTLFTTNALGNTQAGMNAPSGIAYDSTTSRLFVAQSGNNRITVYDVTAVTDGENATNVLGQSTFTGTASGVSSTTLSGVRALRVDTTGQRLFAGDFSNNRVPVFDITAITDGEAFEWLVGQSNAAANPGYANIMFATTFPSSIEYDATNNYLHVGLSSSAAKLIRTFDVATIIHFENAIALIGQYDGTSYTNPVATTTSAKGEENDGVNRFGFRGPQYTAIDTVNHRFYVGDSANSRVLMYNLNASNLFPDYIIDAVIGQNTLFTKSSGLSSTTLGSVGGIAVDPTGQRLFIVDNSNNRVLVYDTTVVTNLESAVAVLGQPNITTNTSLNSQSKLNGPAGIEYDSAGQRLFVADRGNNRVIVYDVASITNGENAINVLGQTTFTGSLANNTQAGMNAPYDIAFDSAGQRLFVTNGSANRVTVYDVASITDGESAIAVLGQATYTASGAANSSTGLNSPRGVEYDAANQRLFVSNYSGSRVLIYDAASLTNGEAAVNVLGQSTFTITGPSTYANASTTVNPIGLTWDSGNQRLYVVDASNNRVIAFADAAVINVELSHTIASSTNEVSANNFPTLFVSGTLAATATVQLAVTGGTATGSGTDYTASTTLAIIIPPGTYTGATSTAISITAPTLVNDALVEGAETITFTLQSASGVTIGDANSNGTTQTTHTYTITDDDVVGFTVVVTDNLTSESGATGAFTIAMTSQPTATTTIALNSSNHLEGTTTVTSVVFTPSNWNVAQTITVTGVDDTPAAGDGAIAYTIITGDVTSTDPAYNALDGTTVTDPAFSNENNDPPGISVSVVGTTTESGGTAIVQFVLLSQPLGGADVTIPLSLTGATEGTTTATTITILNANWNTASANQITVTGVDDLIVDGNQTFTIVTGDPTSADAGYNALTATDVADPTVVNTDNDVAGVTITQSAGTTTVTEGGATDTYTVVLNTQPTATVTVTVTGGAQAGVSPSTLTFTTGNWNVAQTVTVTAVDDTSVEGGHSQTITHTTASTDGAYNALSVASVNASITDNDTISVLVELSASTAASSNEGAADNFPKLLVSGTLSSAATIALAVTGGTATGSGTDYTYASPTSITIPAGTYDGTLTTAITISGPTLVNDSKVDFAETISFILQSASGVVIGDASGNASTISTHTYTITDDDTAGATVSMLSSLTTEAGGTGTFSIVLTSEPSASVTIALSSSNTAEGTVPASVTFTTSNWNTPQVVTVTGVDDVTSDGAQTYTIITGAVTSSDTDYGALDGSTISDLIFTNQDNDAPAVLVTLSATTTNESGTALTVLFTIASQPGAGASVVIPVSIGDATEASLSSTTVTILNANWNTPASNTVTVTGLDDALVDGLIQYLLVTGDPTSLDGAYDALTATDVADPTLATQDNDSSSIVLTESSGSTAVTESASTDTFTVKLGMEPTNNVIITLSSGDVSEGVVSPSSLTFTTANWNVPQTVTVTAIDDLIVDGTISYAITASVNAALSSSAYAGATASISASTADNDSTATASTGGGGGVISGAMSIAAFNPSPQATSMSSRPNLLGGGEPNVPKEFSNYVCERYLRGYILQGKQNDPVEVKKLQTFLNAYEGEKLALDGTYDADDVAAVNRFQLKYADQILFPWGITKPTGNVFRTTAAKINIMLCATKNGCPYFTEYRKQGDESLETVKIQDFLNVIFAPVSGYPNNGLPLTKQFTKGTDVTVRDFQRVYKDTVLKPWNLTSPTGYWFKTTRYAANKLMNCAEPTPTVK